MTIIKGTKLLLAKVRMWISIQSSEMKHNISRVSRRNKEVNGDIISLKIYSKTIIK